ncbi:hypothetical protein CQW23_08170 [Capsicum baccatum]|uniref:Zinc finger PMZ-type domain-containing protein n=1 Tax=Capsicum baccatum TaxID=33114 RepID=A0A2G2X894_CAPBA|nr:hypothetical protein CQW23_08170 [Capsicum baccatum]
MDEREYLVSYIFNSIAKKFGEKFRERHAFVGGKENIFVPFAERILRDNKSVSNSLYVGNPNGVLNEYTVFGNEVTAKVNLLERSCSCQKFDLVKMLCEQAMTALRAKYSDGEDSVTPSTTTLRQFIKLKVTSSHTQKQLTWSLRRLNGLCHRNW